MSEPKRVERLNRRDRKAIAKAKERIDRIIIERGGWARVSR